MKKIIIALVALCAVVSAKAQIGIVAGVTSSKTNLKEAYNDRANITQYHLGLTYKLGIGNILAIQPSLIYNMKGSKLAGLEVAGVSALDVSAKTGYLELPVQLQLGFGLGSLARVYGFAEPFVGYAISNEITAKSAVGAAIEPKKTWDGVKSRLEYGVGLGVGAELIRHIQVSVKYFWNFGDIYGTDGSNKIDLGVVKTTIKEQKCNGIAASVALLF